MMLSFLTSHCSEPRD